MQSLNPILNLPDFEIKSVQGRHLLVFDVCYKGSKQCSHCQSTKVRIKASFIRKVKHHAIGHVPSVLLFKAHKFYCHDCKRFSNQRFPGIRAYQRASESLQQQVFYQHTYGISQKRLVEQFRLGKATIERWYLIQTQREHKESVSSPCPRVLGIDEHSFSKKQGFVTTLCDLRHHKIYDIAKSKKEIDLRSYLNTLKGKSRVNVVCMDLSISYRALARKHFPNAKIVADRFHVVRLLHHQCLKVYRLIAPDIKFQRPLMTVLRKPIHQLTEKQQQRQRKLFDAYPALEAVYDFQCKLYRLLMVKTCKAKRAKQLLPKFLTMISMLKKSSFKPLSALARTFHSWSEEIARMWRFSKSNGITESFHRKMKLIQRAAYGFRNFENYRRRVRVLCS